MEFYGALSPTETHPGNPQLGALRPTSLRHAPSRWWDQSGHLEQTLVMYAEMGTAANPAGM